MLGVVQLVADTDRRAARRMGAARSTSVDSADWAVLVLPVIEGAIRFQIPGAVASWLVLAGTYTMLERASCATRRRCRRSRNASRSCSSSHCRAGSWPRCSSAEIAAHRRGRDEAERRSALLKAAALGGQRSTRLDVDEILDVLRTPSSRMGFAEAQVFELYGTEPPNLTARPVRESRDVLAIPPGDPGSSPPPPPAAPASPRCGRRRPPTRRRAASRRAVLDAVRAADHDRRRRAGRRHRPLARRRRTARFADREPRAVRRPGRRIAAQRAGPPRAPRR